MKLTKAQQIVAQSNHRFRVLCCGRRGGKTVLAVEEIKGVAIYKEARIVYIANTYQQARDIAWQMLLKEFRGIAVKINESRLELEVKNIKGTTSLIQLRGWESIETLRGQTFDFMVIDEVAMMRNFWLYWQEVLRPTLMDRKGSVIFASTPKGFNHFYELYNNKEFKSFHFTTYDNPFIPVEEIEQMKEQMTEDRFAQEVLADFRKTTGLVYKEFNRERHLFEKLPEVNYFERLLGIDFGWNNPTAMVNIYQDADRRYWIRDEWYKTEQTNDQIVEIAKKFNPHNVYADPEAPEKIYELKQKGLNVMEVSKGKGSISNGINKISELFKQNRLFIHKDCINLIWELETYSYPDKRIDVNKPELPIKKDDHLLDALRYIILMREQDQPIYNPLVAYKILQRRENPINFK